MAPGLRLLWRPGQRGAQASWRRVDRRLPGTWSGTSQRTLSVRPSLATRRGRLAVSLLIRLPASLAPSLVVTTMYSSFTPWHLAPLEAILR
jgi:hypothetical protein